MSKSFLKKEVNEFKYVKNGVLYTVEAVNFSKFAGDISFNAEIDGEIRSIIYILNTNTWLYDNEIDVNLDERVYCKFPYEVKSFEHTYQIIEA